MSNDPRQTPAHDRDASEGELTSTVGVLRRLANFLGRQAANEAWRMAKAGEDHELGCDPDAETEKEN